MRKKSYIEPECEPFCASGIEFICQSPSEGGLEGVQEEDWVI
jgi:hypothetical protein